MTPEEIAKLVEELRAIDAAFASSAPWNVSALSGGIRHLQRNTDIMEESGEGEEGNIPGRYDGGPLAELRNALPRILAALSGDKQ